MASIEIVTLINNTKLECQNIPYENSFRIDSDCPISVKHIATENLYHGHSYIYLIALVILIVVLAGGHLYAAFKKWRPMVRVI